MLNAASMVTMALSRLPQYATRFMANEVTWYRWEARVCFLVYTVSCCMLMIMRDFEILWLYPCSRLALTESFVITTCGVIIGLELMYLTTLEIYLRCFPNLFSNYYHQTIFNENP